MAGVEGYRPHNEEAAFKARSKKEYTSRREIYYWHKLAQDFTYEDGKELPAGVSAVHYDFLRDAAEAGALHHVLNKNGAGEDSIMAVHMYFTTEATYEDIARKFRWLHTSGASVRSRI